MNNLTKLKLREAIDEYYGNTFNLSGASQLGWESDTAQHKRFEILLKCKDLNGKKILDLGAGNGDLLRFLNHEGILADYYATEIFEPFFHKLENLIPGRVFNVDVFDKSHFFAPEHFDVVYVAGAFNLSAYSNQKFLLSGLKILARLARESVVLSLLDVASPEPEPQYAYFDPEILEEKINISGWRTGFVRGYLPNDFTLCMDKTDD